MARQDWLLIEALQGDDWWQDVTVTMLETARRRSRSLIKLIERRARKVVSSDVEDQIGEGVPLPLAGIRAVGTDFERFRAKARAFLRVHENRLALHKLRRNQPLTATDLEELERLLVEAGGAPDFASARGQGAGLAKFVCSLVGLDRAAAKALFNDFLAGSQTSANQIEFIGLVIDHLTEQGAMDAARLYESPFTDLSPAGPEALFSGDRVDRLVAVLSEVKARAV